MKVKSQKSKEQLNTQQRAAVDIKTGPALVVAGAGTGKTRVIVERVARLIQHGADPGRIVALTFTEKAAQEMLDRLNELRGGYTFDVTITTYNAFGEQLLRRFAADIGLGGRLTLIEDAAQLIFLREHLDELELDYYAPITNPDGHLDALADYFSKLKQNVVRPEVYSSFADKLPANSAAEKLEKTRHQELARAFAKYIELCKRHSVIDYDDQIYLTLELFEQRPNVLAKVQAEVEHLLVDEFQDTNAMQSKFLDALASGSGNIMVVGDDDQSIYGWRGATLENILSFKERYPKAKEVILTQNYRSSQAILDASYRLVKHNDPHRLEAKHGFDKRLVSDIKGSAPELKTFATHGDELQFVAEDIQRRLEAGQEPGSIAVLARSHTTLARVHNMFDGYGIEHSVAGLSHDLYLQPLIIDVINILQAVADPTDNLSVYQALISAAFDDVSAGQLSKLSAQARREHKSLLELALTSDDAAVRQAAEVVQDWHDQSASRRASQTLFTIFEQRLKPWLLNLLDEPDGEQLAEQAGRDLNEFFGVLGEFERVAVNPTVRGFINNVETLRSAGQNVSDDSHLLDSHNVNVITIHKSKGLEWDTVYLVNLAHGSFPKGERAGGLELPEALTQKDSGADDSLLEERRLMYVAMTRAAKELVLTYAERLRAGGRRQRPSVFIEEALGEQATENPITAGTTHAHDLIMPGQPALPSAKLPSHMLDGDQLVLSASHIETYMFCPLNFYYKYVLHWPEEPSAPAGIGQAVHDAIAYINRSFVDGRELSDAQARDILADNWQVEGFQSKQQDKRAFEKSARVVSQYLARERAAQEHPSLIEQRFSFILPEANTRVHGRFDAVYTGDAVEIRDYKTGEVDSQESADDKAKRSDQLSVYALAWQAVHGSMPADLTLDFVMSGLVGHSTRSQRRIDNVRQKIIEIAEAIRQDKFPPKGLHDFCVHPPIDT